MPVAREAVIYKSSNKLYNWASSKKILHLIKHLCILCSPFRKEDHLSTEIINRENTEPESLCLWVVPGAFYNHRELTSNCRFRSQESGKNDHLIFLSIDQPIFFCLPGAK